MIVAIFTGCIIQLLSISRSNNLKTSFFFFFFLQLQHHARNYTTSTSKPIIVNVRQFKEVLKVTHWLGVLHLVLNFLICILGNRMNAYSI